MQAAQKTMIYSVSDLNRAAKHLLESNFPSAFVEGEISNFSAPASGHWYFSLKDANAQVRCAMFRGQQRHLGFIPKDGMHVLLKARVSLYENRGDYQLIADDMEERGEGKLRRAYEILNKKLEAQGLYAPEHKQYLPDFPRCIGVITSTTGAAIRDILHVLSRRSPHTSVIIYPTLVQGATAAPNIVEALQIANRRKECDVLILARGGGSLEDLWSFNEEIVAHAIYASKIPIVSGIGHEVDFTIADFVADLRAPTPSAAAEVVTADRHELLDALQGQHSQLINKIKSKITQSKQHVVWREKHLAQQHPKRKLAEKMQRLDQVQQSLIQAQKNTLQHHQGQLRDLNSRLMQYLPIHTIHQLQNRTTNLQQQMMTTAMKRLTGKQTDLAQLAAKLDALSPLATLRRGYAIALDQKGNVITDGSHIEIGEQIKVKLSKQTLECVVEKKLA